MLKIFEVKLQLIFGRTVIKMIQCEKREEAGALAQKSAGVASIVINVSL